MDERTIRVWILVCVNEHGNWSSSGASLDVIEGWNTASPLTMVQDDLSSLPGNARRYAWVTAEVPVPVAVEVEGEVSDE